MKKFLLPLALLLTGVPGTMADNVTRIALFGGSSSATTYLPDGSKHHHQLKHKLESQYPGQSVEVFNLADNGEFMARYLLRSRYTKHLSQLRGKNLDLVILRFGINDSKRFSVEEFSEQLRRFIQLLRNDFPGVRIILETGFYLDYPKHYSFDRNRALNPYWDATRALAQELELPLSDVYVASEKATAAGDWDIRIRSLDEKKYPKKPTRFYWETTLDAEYGHEPRWFSDVHPNPHGVGLAVETEAKLLKTLYPERLPTGTGKIAEIPQRDEAFFSEWLNCPPERLNLRRKNPDQLQEATTSPAIVP